MAPAVTQPAEMVPAGPSAPPVAATSRSSLTQGQVAPETPTRSFIHLQPSVKAVLVYSSCSKMRVPVA